MAHVPFTSSQVESLNEYQRDSSWRPITCSECGGKLYARKSGLVCPKGCAIHLACADDFLANWSWACRPNLSGKIDIAPAWFFGALLPTLAMVLTGMWSCILAIPIVGVGLSILFDYAEYRIAFLLWDRHRKKVSPTG